MGFGMGDMGFMLDRRAAGGGAAPTLFWNLSTDTPASSAGYTLNADKTVATRASLSADQMVRGNVGHGTVGRFSFKVTPTIASSGAFIGVAPASQSTADFVGDDSSGVSLRQNGDVYSNGAIQAGRGGAGAAYTSVNDITVIIDSGFAYFQKSGVDIAGMNSTAKTGGIPFTGTVYPAASCDSTINSPVFTIANVSW